jgi:hypothetical protein
MSHRLSVRRGMEQPMNTLIAIRNLSGLGALAFAMGCIAPDNGAAVADEAAVAEDGPIGDAPSAIINGSYASAWMQQRTVVVNTPSHSNGTCTGTIISNTHVLTASHCKVTENGTSSVTFYRNSVVPSGSAVPVTQVQRLPGVFPLDDDFTDSSGNFADIVVLTLASSIPATSAVSPLAISYAGSSASGTQVGRGEHDGNLNTTNVLLYAQNNYYSSDHSGGYFYTNDHRVNGGDSGGPIYTGGQLQGVLSGHWLVAGTIRDKYTAVSFHLPFILNAIGYTGSFSSITSNVIRSGTAIESIVTSDLRTCKLDCMQNSSCVAFSFRPAPVNLCTIYSTLGGTMAWSGATTGIR